MAEEAQVNIEDFLHKRELATQEVKFERFGSPFIIKEISNDMNESLRKQATKTRKLRTGQVVKETDDEKYAELLVLESIVQPDLNQEKLQKFYNALAKPWDALNTMLSMGELKQLSDAVLKLNGLDENLDDEVDDVKK